MTMRRRRKRTAKTKLITTTAMGTMAEVNHPKKTREAAREVSKQ